MSEFTKERGTFVRDHYNAIAKDYQTIVSRDFKLRFGQTVRRLLAEYQLTDGTLLDLGCGPGNLKDELRNFDEGFSYHGVDISLEMLKLAEKKGYCIHGSEILPFLQVQNDSDYDHVFCLGVLSLVGNAEARAIIEEINRVARLSWLISLEQYSEEHLRATKAASGLELHDHSKMRLEYQLSEDFMEIRRYRPRENQAPEPVYSRYILRHIDN